MATQSNSNRRCYQTLGVSPDAVPSVIHASFEHRSLRIADHPIRTLAPAIASETFQRLSRAYVTLTGPDARRRYDGEIHSAYHALESSTESLRRSIATLAVQTLEAEENYRHSERVVAAFQLMVAQRRRPLLRGFSVPISESNREQHWGDSFGDDVREEVDEAVPLHQRPRALFWALHVAERDWIGARASKDRARTEAQTLRGQLDERRQVLKDREDELSVLRREYNPQFIPSPPAPRGRKRSRSSASDLHDDVTGEEERLFYARQRMHRRLGRNIRYLQEAYYRIGDELEAVQVVKKEEDDGLG